MLEGGSDARSWPAGILRVLYGWVITECENQRRAAPRREKPQETIKMRRSVFSWSGLDYLQQHNLLLYCITRKIMFPLFFRFNLADLVRKVNPHY